MAFLKKKLNQIFGLQKSIYLQINEKNHPTENVAHEIV